MLIVLSGTGKFAKNVVLDLHLIHLEFVLF